MGKTKVVGISFPKKLLEQIEIQRGMVPRSTFVVDIVRKALKKAKQ